MVTKPMVTLWSKAAVYTAGDSLMQIQRTVRQECSEIASAAGGWFLHVIEPQDGVAYLCRGDSNGESWQVRIQLAEFVPMRPLPDDHPDPASRGKILKMPYAVETADNEVFAEIGYLDH